MTDKTFEKCMKNTYNTLYCIFCIFVFFMYLYALFHILPSLWVNSGSVKCIMYICIFSL